jgi:MFS family permease
MMNRRDRLGMFAGICWLYASVYINRQLLAILAAPIQTALHVNNEQLGALGGSSFAFVYALLGLYFGAKADRVDRLLLVRTGAWIWSIASLVAAVAPGYAVLITARAGLALGEAIATAASVSLMAELAGDRHRARAASVFFGCAFLGSGLATMGGGALAAMPGSGWIGGWRVALVLAGLPGIAGALFLGLFGASGAPSPPPSANSVTANPDRFLALLVAASIVIVLLEMIVPTRWSVQGCLLIAGCTGAWWSRRLRRLDPAAYAGTFGLAAFRYFIIAFAAILFLDAGASFWLIPYTLRHFSMDAATAGAQLGEIMIVAGIVGCLIGGWAADRWRKASALGRVWTALLAVAAEGAAIAAALAQPDYGGFVVCFAVFCLAGGAWTGVAAAIGLDLLEPDHRGLGTASYFLVTTLLGPGLGPFLVGLGVDLTGSIGEALAWACLSAAISAAALLRLGARIRRPIPRA